ncbi:MAG: PspC domain-containing protein [Actinomycetota bacterium]|nr:PspC domain-containing protein [Actinomycetota bacterium]
MDRTTQPITEPPPPGAAQQSTAGATNATNEAGPYATTAGPTNPTTAGPTYPTTAGPTYPRTGAGPYGPETRWHPLPPAVDYRMRRSGTDKMLAGVCGGIAEHTDIDPVYIRLAFLVSLFWGGIGFVAYAAAALLMPKPLPASS